MKRAKRNGYANGLEKGKEEKNIEIAKKMKNNGITIDAIAEMTGLSKDQIESL